MSNIPTQGEVKIVIEMPEATEGNSPSPASPQKVENTSSNPVDGDKNKQTWLSLAANQAVGLGKQAINASVSNIGISTGNYYLQQKTERAISSVESMIGLGVMAATNPMLAVVSVASMAISASAELKAQNKEREIANYQAAQYAKRLGYTEIRR